MSGVFYGDLRRADSGIQSGFSKENLSVSKPTAKAMAPLPKDESNPSSLKDFNIIALLFAAIARAQSSLSRMQIVDAKSTERASKNLQQIYHHWNEQDVNGSKGVLGYDAAQVSHYANSDKSNMVTSAQTQYNKDSATAQAAQSQGDMLVQSSQTQATTDAGNAQRAAQLALSGTGLYSTLSSLIQRVPG